MIDFKETERHRKVENNIKNAIKSDDDKDRYDLICYEFIEEMARILNIGAQKYGDWNWVGLEKGRLISALQRHFNAFMLKERYDSESQCSHLAHVACNAMMLHYLDLHGDTHPAEIQQF